MLSTKSSDSVALILLNATVIYATAVKPVFVDVAVGNRKRKTTRGDLFTMTYRLTSKASIRRISVHPEEKVFAVCGSVTVAISVCVCMCRGGVRVHAWIHSYLHSEQTVTLNRTLIANIHITGTHFPKRRGCCSLLLNTRLLPLLLLLLRFHSGCERLPPAGGAGFTLIHEVKPYRCSLP